MARIIQSPGVQITETDLSLSPVSLNGTNIFATGFAANAVWSFLHEFNVLDFGSFTIFIGYPLIPWIFVMPLGYYFGVLYTGEVDAQQRRKTLLQLGFGAIALFFALRISNFYGDAVPWEMQESLSMSIASFFTRAVLKVLKIR